MTTIEGIANGPGTAWQAAFRGHEPWLPRIPIVGRNVFAQISPVPKPGHSDHTDFARDLRAILILALAPAVGVGIARFAYSLLLPDMRASLGWSYAAAGFMNTINAVGYLGGALVAAAAMQRLGRFGSIFYGTLVCVVAMALSAATGDFTVLSIVRFAAGVGASIAFVGGGVAAARLSQRHPSQASFLLGLYYIGPGLGIAVSGIGTPLLLDALGPGSWWIAWGALAAVTAVPTFALLAARDAAAGGMAAGAQTRARLGPMMAVLVGYVLFSTGSIAYMTFMIAWLRDAGAGGVAQSAFWTLLGLGGICSPFLWSRLLAALRGGVASRS